ncbi:hypothetical protein Adt_04960 [Abeliophyllum distichum]|uniref:Uncharacterized protein n=1 Tax=Abeliophyllum distichum TaxID=126358 RepID=A0ABD1V2R6_9LAMI
MTTQNESKQKNYFNGRSVRKLVVGGSVRGSALFNGGGSLVVDGGGPNAVREVREQREDRDLLRPWVCLRCARDGREKRNGGQNGCVDVLPATSDSTSAVVYRPGEEKWRWRIRFGKGSRGEERGMNVMRWVGWLGSRLGL